MKKTVKAMMSIVLALALTFGNTAFALDGVQTEPF